MKVRIGVGLGGVTQDFGEVVQEMERYRFDSLWLSEVLSTPVLGTLSGLAYAAGVTRKLKLGTTLLATGRNPVRLAKELATIDRLSNGRLLLVFVPGLTDPGEQATRLRQVCVDLRQYRFRLPRELPGIPAVSPFFHVLLSDL